MGWLHIVSSISISKSINQSRHLYNDVCDERIRGARMEAHVYRSVELLCGRITIQQINTPISRVARLSGTSFPYGLVRLWLHVK